MTKIYKAYTRLTVPVVVDGKIRSYVSFDDENNTLVTSDKAIQDALENLPVFGKLFTLLRSVGVDDSLKDKNGQDGFTECDATDWQKAKEFLRGEPYKIPHQSLGSPEAILKKAEEVKVKFPNLSL